MTSQEQINVFEQFTTAQKKVFSAKGDDYAGQEDRLSNFKVVGAICGMRPELVALVHIATKVARLSTLYRNYGPPKNESIDDSVLDMGNYTFLLQCLNQEHNADDPNLAIAPGVEVRCIADADGQLNDGITVGDTVVVKSADSAFLSFHGKRYLHHAKNFEAIGASRVNV